MLRSRVMDDDRPFDATESYLCDAPEASMGRWHTTSLVTALKGILGKKPGFGRGNPEGTAAAFLAAAGELTRRGLDAVSLVRYGMRDTVASSVINVLAESAIVDENRPGGMSRSDGDAWWAALGLRERPSFSDTPAPAEVQRLVAGVTAIGVGRLLNWIATASLEDLLNLAPPAELIAEEADSGVHEDELQAQYRWAVDHFSSTFYSEWATSSLHYAFRYLAGQEVAPCSADLMAERRIDPIQLNGEIARRAATRPVRRRPSRQKIDTLMAADFYARSLLDRKRYLEAAAVYKFAASERPYDGNFRNNLGFCLVPEDALEALGHFKAAAEMNYPRPAINTYNQMRCYIALRQPREALAIADQMWPIISSSRAADARLWRYGSPTDEWATFHTDDDRMAVAELVIDLSRREDWKETEESWQERRAKLTC